MKIKNINRKGFTLTEILVAVVIMGVLTAIAIPTYKKSVMKSRLSALMPTAKAISAGNEEFFMSHGRYTDDLEDLAITIPTDIDPDSDVELNKDIEYAYVLVTYGSGRNKLLMYQQNSENYPGEIHCEAKVGDKLAESVCESLGSSDNIGTTISDGYTTYISMGRGNGIPPNRTIGNWQSCEGDIYPCTKECTRQTTSGYSCSGTYNQNHTFTEKVCSPAITEGQQTCTTVTYDEEGQKTRQVTCDITVTDKCVSKVEKFYDEYGNLKYTRTCIINNADGSCNVYAGNGFDYTYDANGNRLTKRRCQTFASDGSCTAYASYDNWDYTYDANGNQLTKRSCKTVAEDGSCSVYNTTNNFDYTYDANGNMLTQRSCQTLAADGSCSAYNTSSNWDYTYDANGNKLTQRRCQTVAEDGSSCSAYSTAGSIDYTYDANGNTLTERQCKTFASDGSCSAYAAGGTYYTYDANGKMFTQRNCQTVAADGSCSAYSTSNYYYAYDANGNQLTKRSCKTLAADGSCSVYNTSGNYDYTYDANGNQLTERQCQTVGSDGSCSAYSTSSAFDYTYDENGNQTSRRSCNSFDGTTCTSWSNPFYFN